MNRIKLALIPRLMKWGGWIPDSIYLKLLFYLKMGQCPDLKKPVSFNEKLQWLKLHDRKLEYTIMVDKYAVKEYVAQKIGKDYIIPTIGLWNKPEEIDWETLPNQFVLKTTHGGGGGGIIICKDKNEIDKEKAIQQLNNSLRQDIYRDYREWPYKNVPRRIMAEPYLTDNGKPLEDFKVHNFNGSPQFILLCRDRFSLTGLTDDFYTPEWKHLEVKRPGKDNPGGHEQPKNLPEMLSLAKILSKDIPFIRTDFYSINGKVFFGELTFYPASGMSHFEPEAWDVQFGKILKLDI